MGATKIADSATIPRPVSRIAGLPEWNADAIRAALATGSQPFVTLKAATTLDGKIAMPNGESRWITGAPARELGHRLRAAHHAVLVGIGTVLADNPALTVRLADYEGVQPARIVLDSVGRLPDNSLFLSADGARRIVLAGSDLPPSRHEALIELGAEVFQDSASRPRPATFLPWLRERGIETVLVEGGGGAHATFIANACANTLFLFVAGKVIGGSAAPGWCGALGLSRLADAPRLHLAPPRIVGEDVLIFGEFVAADPQ